MGCSRVNDWRYGCQGKAKFNKHEKALNTISKYGMGGEVETYRCRFCRKVHIGHPPTERRVRK